MTQRLYDQCMGILDHLSGELPQALSDAGFEPIESYTLYLPMDERFRYVSVYPAEGISTQEVDKTVFIVRVHYRGAGDVQSIKEHDVFYGVLNRFNPEDSGYMTVDEISFDPSPPQSEGSPLYLYIITLRNQKDGYCYD